MMDQGKQEAELRGQRKRPVKIRRDGAAFTRYSRYGGKEIAAEGADLEPPGARIVPAPDCQHQCPCEADDDDEEQERKERPPDLGIEHGRRL